MIDALSIWKTGWAALPKVANDSWKSNMADFIAARLDGKMVFATYAPPSTFTFNKSLFIAGLAGVSSGTGDGVAKIASSFQSAVEAPGSMVVAPGSAFGTPSPATTFSVVSSTVLLGVAAKAKIEELASAPLVTDPLDSAFPVKLYEASLLVTGTVTGINSVTPTPAPLVDANRAVQ